MVPLIEASKNDSNFSASLSSDKLARYRILCEQ